MHTPPQFPRVIVSPAPFASQRKLEAPVGATVGQLINLAYDDALIDQAMRGDMPVAVLDGVVVERADYDVKPMAGQLLEIYFPVHGSGKSPLRILLTVAVVAAAAFTGGAAGAALFGSGFGSASVTAGAIGTSAFGAAVTSAFVGGAIIGAGTLLVNAIAPIRTLKEKQEDQTYSITGARNQIAPFAPIMTVLGRHRIFPPFAAKPYTEIVGNDEFVRMLFYFAGPSKIEDIRIGDTPFQQFSGFADDGESVMEVREGWDTDAPITLFPSVVNQVNVNAALTNAVGLVSRVMPAGFSELGIAISFPQGLIHFNAEGKKTSKTVTVNVKWRIAGAPTWNDLTTAASFSQTTINSAGKSPGLWRIYATALGEIESFPVTVQGLFLQSQRPGSKAIASFTVNQIEKFTSVTNEPVAGQTGMSASLNGAKTIITVTAGTLAQPVAAFTNITGKTTQALRRSFSLPVDPLVSYEVALTRETPDDDSTRTSDKVFWTTFTGTKNNTPIKFPFPVAQIAMRVKADDALNGQIDTINCIASSYAPRVVAGVWETSATEVTSNPAALFRMVTSHNTLTKKVNPALIDDAMLKDWYDFNEAEGYKFNRVYESQQSVWDTLADIAFAGRAAPSIRFGKWGADIDKDGRLIEGHLTPRNSWGFSSQKILVDMPHGFRIIFANEEKDYREDEIIVFDDGFDESSATVFERLNFRGLTDPALVWKFGRFHIAQARLRPEIYTAFMDMEHLTFNRNSLIMAMHDVPRWGDNWAKVKAIITSGSNTTGVTLDDTVTIEAGLTYAARFRLSDGTSLVLTIQTVVGEQSTLMFVGAIPTSSGPQIDDLVMFNESDKVSVELICHSIRRQSGMIAQLSFYDHSPAIYLADQGVIPPFNSQISGRLIPLRIGLPIIESVTAELYQGDIVNAELKRRVVIIGRADPEFSGLADKKVIVRCREKDSADPWIIKEFAAATRIEIEVETEGVYEYQIKLTGIFKGVPSFFGLAESNWTPLAEIVVRTQFELGLPATTNITGFYDLDAQGRVSKVKLRMSVDISGGAIPTAVALMFSVQQEPREVTVTDFGTHLVINSVEVLNSGTFKILAGSAPDNIVIATTDDPLPQINLAGMFWGSLDAVEFRKATGSDDTGIQFANPFSTTPVVGQNATWIEVVFADERESEFRLLNLIASNGSTEVAKWGMVKFIGGQYRLEIVARAQEGTTQVNAIKAQYYPAPGAGTETITIPASNFTQLDDNFTFEGSADVQVTIPAGSWGAATLATYDFRGMRIVRSPIVPITNWRQL